MTVSERTQRMIDSAPDYYQYSVAYQEIQNAVGEDLDRIAANNEDLKKQRRVLTATWGLKFWEQRLKIPTIEADSYEIRRSRVLSKMRGFGKFSASLIEAVAEAYSNGDVDVTINIPDGIVIVTFVGTLGIPPNLDDLKTTIDNIVHAHLGVEYKFRYNTYDIMENTKLTYDGLNLTGLTYAELLTTEP